MRSLAYFSVLVLLAGCAHTTEMHESSSSTVVSAPPPPGEVIAVDEQAPAQEAPRPRPKLTQTITLGQSNGDATYSTTPAEPGAQTGSGPNVIVNNNIVVNPPAVYGVYPGYGYGYGGGGGSYARGMGGRGDGWGRGGGASPPVTGNGNGWEGSRRTAAPGATPGVGGNWSAPHTSGPSQMK